MGIKPHFTPKDPVEALRDEQEQIELAGELAEMLQSDAHGVFDSDILDALASCGLALVRADDDAASRAYVAPRDIVDG